MSKTMTREEVLQAHKSLAEYRDRLKAAHPADYEPMVPCDDCGAGENEECAPTCPQVTDSEPRK